MIRSKFLNPILVILVLLAAGGILTDYFDSSPVQAQNQGRATDPADRPIQSLRDLSNAFVEIADEVRPSVVTVFSERVMRMRNPFFDSPFGGFFDEFFGPQGRQGQREQEFRQTGLGSGVIVSEDGYIVTNNHVIQDADTIYVRTADNQQFAAEVVGADPRTDLAVLRIETNGLRPIRLGNSDDIRVGEWVVAVGSPLSPDLAQTVTQGIVSAKGRSNVGLAEYEDFIQTDAAINPGNSGGPLVNLDGELVGLNTAIATRSGGYQGIGFAVPVNMVRFVMESLIEEGRVVRGWLGVSIQDITESMGRALGLEGTEGALVGEVVPDSPADEAGVQEGDVILTVEGQPIGNSTELRNRIAGFQPGTRVNLTVFRDGSKDQVRVQLGEMPGQMALAEGGGSELQELLGFSVADATPDDARRNGRNGRGSVVAVTDVDPMSAAYGAGLRQGDVILSVNRRPVRSTEEFTSLVGGFEKGDDVLLRIQRQGGNFFVAFTL